MSDPKPKGELVNRSRCARTFGVALTTLDAWIAQGCPVYRKSPRRGIETLLDTGVVHEWRLATAVAEETPDNLDAQQAKARLLRLQGDRAELELALRRRELVPVYEVEKADEVAMRALRDRLLLLPQAVAPRAAEVAHVGGAKAVAAVIKTALHAALEDISTATFVLDDGTEVGGR